MKDSPYLEPCRLGEVIAALQVMSYYKFYKLDVVSWAERISGNAADAAHLESVLLDHPEFFRVTGSEAGAKASLVARRSFPKDYDVDAGREIGREAAMAKREDAEAWGRLSRRPLTPDEMLALIRTAVDLHNRAVEQRKAGYWWIPLATAGLGFLGGLTSAVVGLAFGG